MLVATYLLRIKMRRWLSMIMEPSSAVSLVGSLPGCAGLFRRTIFSMLVIAYLRIEGQNRTELLYEMAALGDVSIVRERTQ